jgi:ketosteroid isomerase-like protein
VAIPNGYVVQWRDEYTAASTGGRVSYRGVSILDVADGELAREVAYYDRATIHAQEGGTCEGPAAAGTPEAGG